MFGDLDSYRVGLMVNTVELGQVFLRGLLLCPLSNIPLMLPTHAAFIYHRRYITSTTESVIKQNTSVSRSL
jgi:hypothetical protein